MDKRNTKDSNDLVVKSFKISYRGVGASDEAKYLHDNLCQQLNLKINPPAEISGRLARLGVAEILITIILTTIAKTTLEAILNNLEKYLLEKYLKSPQQKSADIQIIIKQDDTDVGKRFPFRLSNAKPIALKALFATIRELISKVGKRD